MKSIVLLGCLVVTAQLAAAKPGAKAKPRPDGKLGAHMFVLDEDGEPAVVVRPLSDQEDAREPSHRKQVRRLNNVLSRDAGAGLSKADAAWRGAEIQLYRGLQTACRARIRSLRVAIWVDAEATDREAWARPSHILVGVLDKPCPDVTWGRLASLPPARIAAAEAAAGDVSRATEAAMRGLPSFQKFWSDHAPGGPTVPSGRDERNKQVRGIRVLHLNSRTLVWALTTTIGSCDSFSDYWALWEDREQGGKHQLTLLAGAEDGYAPTVDGVVDLDGDGEPALLLNRGTRVLRKIGGDPAYWIDELRAEDLHPDC